MLCPAKAARSAVKTASSKEVSSRPGGGDDLAEVDAGQRCGDDVGGGHAGGGGEVHALHLVEFGGDDSGADDVGADPGAGELGVRVWVMATVAARVPT